MIHVYVFDLKYTNEMSTTSRYFAYLLGIQCLATTYKSISSLSWQQCNSLYLFSSPVYKEYYQYIHSIVPYAMCPLLSMGSM